MVVSWLDTSMCTEACHLALHWSICLICDCGPGLQRDLGDLTDRSVAPKSTLSLGAAILCLKPVC